MPRPKDPEKLAAYNAEQRAKYHALSPEIKTARNQAQTARNAKRRATDPEYVAKRKAWEDARRHRIQADPELLAIKREQQKRANHKLRATPEGRQKHVEHSVKWSRKNPEKVRGNSKRFYDNHPEKQREKHKRRYANPQQRAIDEQTRKRNQLNLTEGYIMRLIIRPKNNLTTQDKHLITKEIIELKRLVVTLKRELKKQAL